MTPMDPRKDPYVPVSAEEVSVLRSLKHWTNVNVRVVGRFLAEESSMFSLQGVNGDTGNVCLNLECLDQYPVVGDILEVFGKLYEERQAPEYFPEQTPPKVVLKVMFSVPIYDVVTHNQVVSLIKPYIPSFFKRDV